jgi:RNA recognition motif-containing protein
MEKALPTVDEEGSQSVDQSGTGRSIAPAGELAESFQNVKETKDAKQSPDHTVVDLPSAESSGSTEKTVDAVPEAQQAIPAFVFPSSYTTVEPTADQSKNTLVIKNLPFKYKPVDLEALLAEHQAKPKNVRLLRDDAGRFSGMAFIRCISKEEAQRLIFSMNDLDIGGRNIQVEFKMKKKKKGGSLRTSTDDASSLSSSSDELPVANRLRVSAENVSEKVPVPAPAQIQPVQPTSSLADKPKPSGPRKLAVSAEHNFQSDKFRKPPQMRRKSTSAVLESAPAYAHSALSRIHPALVASSGPSIRPIRQPIGPDGKTNGFSAEYRKLRGQ